MATGPPLPPAATSAPIWRFPAISLILFALAAPTPGPIGGAAGPSRASIAVVAAPIAVRSGFLDYTVSGVRSRAFDAARAINADIPFARVPVLTAPPFFISGASEDRARAIDCLAAAAYYEAGSDERGQRAVTQVVLNRLRDPAYPKSVCEVIFQGHERRTGCQFTFTCDGAMARHRPSSRTWHETQRVALEALNGYTDQTVGHATHYHTDWVHPYWSRSLDKIAAVDSHLFFQAKVARPDGFSAGYRGAEPRIARLSWLSAAHGDPAAIAELSPMASSPAIAETTTPPVDRTIGATERLPDKAGLPGPDIFMVTLDAGGDPDGFRRMAEMRCAGRGFCKLIGWTNPGKRSSQFPIAGTAIDAISFTFSRTGPSEPGEARWNCREFPRSDAAQCLNRGS
jgi:hypothetical protein